MHLVELIPCTGTDAEILDDLERFLVTTLGKGVIRAKDTPNFIANRVGVFSMLATIHHAERLGIGFDTVDALTGALIGRPKSATFRTADVVGLDTFAHVVNTMKDALPDDPWHQYYVVPAWLQALIDKGALGQKTRKGVYQKVGRDIHVLDLKSNDYRLSDGKADEAVVEILKNRIPAERFGKAACIQPSAGAIHLVDIPRFLPLLCVASAGDRRQRARSGFCGSLGLRLGQGAVRDLAVGGLAAGGGVDCRRHRGRPRDDRYTAAGLGR